MGEFGGVIGPTWRESTAWWPPDPEPPAGAPNVLLVVLDDVGYAQLGCYGSDIDTPVLDGLAGRRRPPHALPHHRALLTDARVPAHRAQPPLQRHGARRRPRGRLPGVQRDHPPRERLPLRDPRRRTATCRSRSASGTSRPQDEIHFAAPRDSWPCGRGFRHWYGFHGGETHQFVPNLFRDHTAVAPAPLARRGLPPHRGPRRRGDRDARRAALAPSPTRPSTCTSPPAPATRRTTRPRSGGRATAAGSTPAGTSGASATFARQQALGLLPDIHGARRRGRTGSRRGTSSTPDDQQVAARFMECFAAFLVAHRRADRAGARRSSTSSASSTTRSSSSCPTTARRPRAARSAPSTTRGSGTACPPAATSCARRIDEIGTETHPQQLPVGLDDGGQHPVPPLEARGARGRRRRSVHRALAARHPRRAVSSGHQFAHAIDVLPTLLELIGVDAPAEIDGSHAGADRGHELRLPARRRRRARAAHHAVLRDARLARRSTTTGGRR